MCNNTATGASKKINAAYGMDTGGAGNIVQTSKEIERLMGFRPDKYVIVNFDGIAAIVDAIGGVDYDVPFDMKYDDPSQNLHIDLKKRSAASGRQADCRLPALETQQRLHRTVHQRR